MPIEPLDDDIRLALRASTIIDPAQADRTWEQVRSLAAAQAMLPAVQPPKRRRSLRRVYWLLQAACLLTIHHQRAYRTSAPPRMNHALFGPYLSYYHYSHSLLRMGLC